uniref:Fork-head domain-containing protein n=1 Tax=Mola mola TaxID=94237 RepID=A0A3Q4BW23_MOLML
MQSGTEMFGAQLPLFVPASSSQQRLVRKSTTYLAKIAVVLQGAPHKMLTFPQVRQTKTLPVLFSQVPVVPDSLDSKRNYWKLDPSQITAKMVRRHFKGILQLFPELASKVEPENKSRASEHHLALDSPEPATCRTVQLRCEGKFSSPFSIESLLKRDTPPARGFSASPISAVQAGTKRTFSWSSGESLLPQASAGHFPICSTGGSTHHRLTANRAAKPLNRMYVHTEGSFPVYTTASAAPYSTSPHSSYINYSIPTFTHDALCFSL